MTDIQVQFAGSVTVLRPLTDAGREWVEDNLPEDAQRWAGGIVVESRFVDAIIDGAEFDGLDVSIVFKRRDYADETT